MPRLISHHTSRRQSRSPRARSESARLCAPHGGCCCVIMRSAGISRQQTCYDRLGCGGILTAAGLCSLRCSFVSGCQMRCGASVTCAPLRRHQMACLSARGVARPGCRSPLRLPLGPTSAFQDFNRPRAVANRRRREGHWQPTSVTALCGPDFSRRRPGPSRSRRRVRVRAGDIARRVRSWRTIVGKGPTKGPTIIRDYSRRPRIMAPPHPD
jgi:hypothetical protein